MTQNFKKIRVLATASGGGHWVQLLRLCPAWDGCTVSYVTTSESRREEIKASAQNKGIEAPLMYIVVDANRWRKYKLFKQLVQIFLILLKERPHVIITTGASLGFFALRIGKWMGARTIWVDSIANSEELSLAGKKAGSCADLWLTQWEHLSVAHGRGKRRPEYRGAVI